MGKLKSKVQKSQKATKRYENVNKGQGLTRKDRRKQERIAKKARRANFQAKKYGLIPKEDKPKSLPKDQQETSKKPKRKRIKRTPEEKHEINVAKMRTIQLKEANEEEDKNIQRLAKQLGIKKKKNKNLFANDGLGYILEVLEHPENPETSNFIMNDSDSDINDDLQDVLGKPAKKQKMGTKDSGSDQELSESDNEENFFLPNMSKPSKKESDDQESNGKAQSLKTKKQKKVERKSEKSDENESNDGSDFDDMSSDQEGSFSDEEVSSEFSESKTILKKVKVKSDSNDQVKKKTVRWSDGDKDPVTSPKGVLKRTNKLELKSNKTKSKKSVPQTEPESSDVEDSEASDFGSSGEEPDPESDKINKGLWEDIYGRTRDKEGNIVKAASYVPPAKRALMEATDSKKKAELLQINRQIKGLLNRVSESNMKFIVDQIEDMYRQHSRNDMNSSLTKLILDSVVMFALTPERLVMEHCLLLALLHGHIGTEIGAHCLQTFVTQLHQKVQSEGNYREGKEIDNLVMLICHLYTFKVTHNVLIFDIVNLLAEKFIEKHVELILLILRSIGFSLRRDNPLALKEMILSLQSKATASDHAVDQSRIRFMIDTVMALRNNNMHKIPNYDPSTAEHLKKVLKGLQRKGTYIQELHISLADLLNAEEKGRWWIVGSAWQNTEGPNPQDNEITESTTAAQVGKVSQEILELARKQRMNTESRKNIFCIVMSAEDYMDAFEKLLHLRLKNQQEREIIHVIMDCCLQEKLFNPFYAHLTQKFCNFDRRFQMTLQFALWDKFKDISTMGSNQLKNLAQFVVHQLAKGALPLSVLKVIQLSEMEKPLLKFLRQVLLSLLLNESNEDTVGVFHRVSSAPKLHLFREGLRLFMHHFLLRNKDKMEKDVAQRLEERVRMAVDALMESDRRR